MKISITKEKFSLFSEEDISFLKRAGVEVKRKNAPREKKRDAIPKPKPYILKTYLHCRICNHITETVYLMQQDEDVLVSKRIDKIPENFPSEMVIKESHYNTRCCVNCTEHLMSLPKEEIIRKLLVIINDYTLY